tara:strand:- start:214 stop:975 length:762 start_codon:yes stop_codon:yes gene_type:complete
MDYIRLLEYKTNSVENLRPFINDTSFIDACAKGNLDLLKWMIDNDSTNCIHISGTRWNKEYPFKVSCANGHLDVSKWLLEIKPDINISVDCEDAFRYACREGHLDIAKWLYEVKPNIDISVCFYEPVRYACGYGYLELAKWLYSTFSGIDLNICDQFPFPHINYLNHPEVVQWMNSVRNNADTNKYGAVKEIIYSLEVERNVEKDTSCPVCYEKGNIETSCGHYGCEDCFSKIPDHTCPYCRQFITDYFKIKD